MADKLLFLTGKLAEKSLHKVLQDIQDKNQANPKTPPFKYRIEQIGVSVAALMTPEMIARRLKSTGDANKMILPGLCQGDLSQLHRQYGIPAERGPEDLKDLPQYFDQQGIVPDLSQYSVQIFAEIVDASDLSVDAIVKKAEKFKAQGANVIDLGCLPNKPFKHLADSVKALKQAGFKVSVDSMNSDELLLAGKAGADYLLSLTEKTLWIADAVQATPVLIPSRPGNMASLYRAIEFCLKNNKPFIADAILDPIHFGLADSIVRYHRLRKKYPKIDIMMGIGNLTELTDADTTGINAMLFGLISELNINAVLATSVSPHATNSIAEADIARRVMHAAKRDGRLPRGYSTALNGLHDRRPFSYNAAEIAEFAAQIKDPSFRIMVSEAGVHVYNRDGLHIDVDPFAFYPNLGVKNDASHAFYLGVELARAQIAHQLKKRYVQDEELKWGFVSDDRGQKAEDRKAHREASLKEKTVKKMQQKLDPRLRGNDGEIMIFETIIITQDSTGKPHAAPFGVRYEQDKVIISPYKPSATLDNILATKLATLNITDDVRVFAGALTNHINISNIHLTPLQPNTHAGYRLSHALSHSELRLMEVKEDATRPQLVMEKVAEFNHQPFVGFNRAQAAVIELCILVSRLTMLPREKIEAELAYLQIAIDKTAGECEREAWGWLTEKIENFYAANKA